MLSRFCLHSYQNEVLGGPRLSITAGLQLFASLWPGFNSRAYKLSLNSVEQGPFSPPFCHCLLTNAPRLPLPDTCLLPTFCSLLSDGLLCILAWFTVSCFISAAAGSPASHQTGLYHAHSHSLCPNCSILVSRSGCELGLLCKNLCTGFFFLV